MADITWAKQNTTDSDNANSIYLWETLTSANANGTKLRLTGFASDIIVQAVGTFGSATVTMQGSLDGTTWVTLKDPGGANVSFTAAGGAAIRDKWKWVRPSTAGGDGTQDIDVYLLVVQ